MDIIDFHLHPVKISIDFELTKESFDNIKYLLCFYPSPVLTAIIYFISAGDLKSNINSENTIFLMELMVKSSCIKFQNPH